MSEVKFTEEEMQKLAGLQQSYQNLQSTFGQLKVQRIMLEQQLEGLEETEMSIEEQYKTAQQDERNFVKELNEKYGPGTLDPATGTFTPTETPEATTESTGAPK
jgi:septal ring factor EnvC (AmiA/AmiB activator)